jgi:N-acetylglucosamine transport system substrate-binding protein
MKAKSFLVVAILCSLVFSLPAFSQTPKNFENKDLEIACFEGGYGRDLWIALKDAFEKDYPGVKVNLIINPEIYQMMRPRVAAGNPPDLMPGGVTEKTGLILSMQKDKNFVPLNDVFDEKALDSDKKLRDLMVPGCLDNKQVAPYGDGAIAFAPQSLSPMGFVYNKNYFVKNNLKVPITWADFFALGDQIKSNRALFTYQGIYASYNESFILPAIASSAGMAALQKIFNYEEGAWRDPNVKRVLQVFADIGTKGYLMKGTTGLNHTQSQADMMMGKAVFIPNGDWMKNEMKDAPREDGFEFALMAPPVFSEKDTRYALTGFQFIFIPKKAKNPELAKEFLRYMYSGKGASIMAEKASQVAPVQGVVEKLKAVLSKTVYNFAKVYDDGTATLIADWKPLPAGTKLNYQREIYENSMTDVINGQMTVDQWVEKLETVTKQLREEAAKAK